LPADYRCLHDFGGLGGKILARGRHRGVSPARHQLTGSDSETVWMPPPLCNCRADSVGNCGEGLVESSARLLPPSGSFGNISVSSCADQSAILLLPFSAGNIHFAAALPDGRRSKAALKDGSGRSREPGKPGERSLFPAGQYASRSLAWNAADVDVNCEGVRVLQVRRTGKGRLFIHDRFGGSSGGDRSGTTSRGLRRALAEERAWRIVSVLGTHIHGDHLSRAEALASSAERS
jgi:hypothetical protein